MKLEKLQTTRPRLLQINEVCAQLGLSRTSVYELMNKGEIAYLVLGARRRVPVTEVERIVGEARRAELI